jgi:hypothetical protein
MSSSAADHFSARHSTFTNFINGTVEILSKLTIEVVDGIPAYVRTLAARMGT